MTRQRQKEKKRLIQEIETLKPIILKFIASDEKELILTKGTYKLTFLKESSIESQLNSFGINIHRPK
ncbi:hypothetical protein ACE193_15355 [Bernardetia sp. OM2101]|uniref:hypothetical protein n=1 Tax=Bernardetia sp. OM2101 TaxID=3344876 RepID=UPI0035CF762A